MLGVRCSPCLVRSSQASSSCMYAHWTAGQIYARCHQRSPRTTASSGTLPTSGAPFLIPVWPVFLAPTCLGAYATTWADHFLTDGPPSGESKSHSTTARKNLDASKRRRVGHLYDGVLSIHEYEVGAAEHARTWLGEVERKWVVDSRKVVKALHDMLYELQTPGVQVIGLITAGWRCQLLRMMYAKGYVCLVGADRIRKVPTPQEGIAPLLEMLSLVWKMKVVYTFRNCDLVLWPT